LYKIRSEEGMEKLSNTWFDIDPSGEYVISDAQGTFTNGKVFINIRHIKMIFEQDSTIWNAWFYGRELRIDNPETGIQYSLRKEPNPKKRSIRLLFYQFVISIHLVAQVPLVWEVHLILC
jgi:hypothetical protein